MIDDDIQRDQIQIQKYIAIAHLLCEREKRKIEYLKDTEEQVKQQLNNNKQQLNNNVSHLYQEQSQYKSKDFSTKKETNKIPKANKSSPTL